jgi:uncharacterized coiled-coil DUF342 family protein
MSELSPTDIAVQLNECHNSIELLNKRMDKAEQIIDQIRELNTTTQLIAQKQNTIETTINSLSETVNAIDSQPREKWNKASWIVLSSFITAAVGMIITAISNFIK